MRARVASGVEAISRRLMLAALGAAALVGGAPARAADNVVAGDVMVVKVWAFGTAPDARATRDLHRADPVYVRDRLETVRDGALHVRLEDDTELRLGSLTSVVLDEFVYQPDANAATVLTNISKGVARFITGKVARKNFVVTSPAATITARGTIFSVWVQPNGTTTVWVQEGQVEVTPRNGRPSAVVDAGGIVAAPLEGDIDLDAPRPAPEPGIAPTPNVQQQRGKNK
jgi:ferric-dicitrate binding protein FerR (iron transport regulator)